jgi:all-trans-retinol 13,14-reductase
VAKYQVAIIGSGLGGLLCGNILSKEGYSVCVLEKNRQIGGCLQVFARNGKIFNTGLNYTEGLGEGQILYKYFNYLGLMDKLKLRRLDVDGFERITFQGEEYKYSQGHDLFIETLAKQFPEERKALIGYIDKLKEIGNSFPLYNLQSGNYRTQSTESFDLSVSGFLKSLTNNTKLQNVLAGTNLLYAGVPDKTPLYIHSLIMHSFINSAWRLVDGSHQLAIAIAKSIKSNGGEVLRNTEAMHFKFKGNQISSIETKDGDIIEADTFISNAHPATTLKMIDGSYINKAYRNRITSLENTIGMFSLYIVLKENSFKYQNYNNYYHHYPSVWATQNYSKNKWPQSYMLYTPANSKSEEWAENMIIMSYMKFSDVKKWENTYIENRGEDYLVFKNEKTEALLDIVALKFPDIRKCIQHAYTSTPLTYRDYTATPEGSSYGVLKDYMLPYKTMISPRTKIQNLFFTGQNLNLHGILGVTIGAVMTCGEIIGHEYLVNKIIKNNS